MWKRPKTSKLTKGLSIEQAEKLVAEAQARQRDLLRLKASGQLDDDAARELEVLTSRIVTMKKDIRNKNILIAERALEKDGDTGGLIELKTSQLHPMANTGAEIVRRALEDVIATGVWPEVAPDPSAPPLMQAAYKVFGQLRKQSGGVPPKNDPILSAIVARDVEQMVRVATKMGTALRKQKKSKPKGFAKA